MMQGPVSVFLGLVQVPKWKDKKIVNEICHFFPASKIKYITLIEILVNLINHYWITSPMETIIYRVNTLREKC